jgi:beta-N-acetylhexosaminidase
MRALDSRSRWLVVLKYMAAVLFSSAWVFVALNLRSPYLMAVRDTVFWIWACAGILVFGGLVFQKIRIFILPNPLHLVTCAALLGGLLAGHGRWLHSHHRRMVNSASHMPEMGNHLVIGWLGREETLSLAAKGAIAGVFLTRRNFPAKSTRADIRRVVDELQAARHEAGLPPLWIATDQEGGPVAKLSPAISPQPAMKTLLEDLDGPDLANQPARAVEIVRRVTDYADAQGRELAEAGINLNFAPVVDLQPKHPPDLLDFHSRIATRALASDPAVVALTGETYVRTLAKHGVTAVLKHFPGLGSVSADTHHFAATLDIPINILTANDWLPFREISKNTGSGIMLSHVRVGSLDPGHPVSCSREAVRFLRRDWAFRGLLVTDDFSMAPISHGPGGIIRAARQGMAAGVDLILLSYDPGTVYDLLGRELTADTL